MKNNRPININPLSIRLPIPALVSISHRISGVVIFLMVPLMLYVLQQSIVSEQSYADLMEWLSTPILKFLLWAFWVALFFHVVAGIRHLIMDMHWGESLRWGRLGAMFVFLLTLSFAAVVAVRLYLGGA